jgi:predicted AAA+ superfamily ATPase
MQEIQSLLDIFIPEARVYYLRTHDGLELDGIIKRGQMLIPFEVKSSRSVKTDDADNIKKWKTLSGHKDIGFVFYAGNKVMPLGEDIWAVPI